MPRKPIRSEHWRLMNQRLSMHFTRKKQYSTQILPVLQIFFLESFSNASGKEEKKKLFSRFLYPGIGGSIPGPDESMMGASTKTPVLFTEQKELNPYSPSPSLSWLHLMCRTHRLGSFLSPAQKLQILVKCLMSNSLAYMFQKTLKSACLWSSNVISSHFS